MKNLIALFVLAFLTACTTTHVSRTDGINKFEASNTSWGWEREDLSLSLKKPDATELEIRIGKSSGKEGLDRAITGLESTIKILKGVSK